MPDRDTSLEEADLLPRLQMIPLFSRFSPADILGLLGRSHMESYPAGHLLFERGAPLAFLYILLDGQAELSTEADGQSCVIDICRQNAVLGDAAVFSQDVSQLSARTLAPVTVLAIPAANLLAFLESRFDMQLHVLSVLSQRLRGQVKQIAELKLKTTAQRLGIYLLSQAAQTKGPARIDLAYDKRRIADELGMQPESLSRSLAKLGRLGVESLPGNSIEIADIARLRAFCIADD